MGVLDHPFEEGPGRLPGGMVGLEILPRPHHQLIRREGPAGMPAHPVPQDRQHQTRLIRMHQEVNPILLLEAISLMAGQTGIDTKTHGGGRAETQTAPF